MELWIRFFVCVIFQQKVSTKQFDAINILLQNGYLLIHFIFSTIHNKIKFHINNINSLNNKQG